MKQPRGLLNLHPCASLPSNLEGSAVLEQLNTLMLVEMAEAPPFYARKPLTNCPSTPFHLKYHFMLLSGEQFKRILRWQVENEEQVKERGYT